MVMLKLYVRVRIRLDCKSRMRFLDSSEGVFYFDMFVASGFVLKCLV